MSLTLPAADEACLLATPLFSGLKRDTVLALLDGAIAINHPDGGLLFSQGDSADRFFVVLAGRVNLLALTDGGEQSIIEVINPGETFAEAAIFASGRFPLTAEMAAATRLLTIPAASFLHRLSRQPGLPAQLLAALAHRQRRLTEEVADLKGRSPVQRLGLFLLGLAESAGPTAELRLPLTKTQLASRLGLAPESLSRALARLRPMGVTTQGRGVLIGDREALRRFCGEG